jgi:hypothetical protein
VNNQEVPTNANTGDVHPVAAQGPCSSGTGAPLGYRAAPGGGISRANKRRRFALAVGTVAVISLVAAACSGGSGKAAASTTSNKPAAGAETSPVATGLEAAGSSTPTSASGPPAAFRPAASGTIASVSGDVLEVQNTESGQTTVNVTSKTVITATVSVSESDIAKGTCISATGTKGSGGSVDATTVALFAATKGQCTRGFGAGGAGGGFRFTRGTVPGRTTGTRPGTTFKRPANFASASGKVTSKSGTKINVEAVTVTFSKGKATTKTGPKTVNVSKSTKYTKTERVTTGSLKVGECVTATGSTNNIGAVSATNLIVTPATSSGCSTFGFGFAGGGFRGPGGPGGGA